MAARRGPGLHREAFRDAGPIPRIRHPLYVGWIITFWATPSYTVGHLLFASVMTGYILVAIPFEERDLAAQLGKPYGSGARAPPRSCRASVAAVSPT